MWTLGRRFYGPAGRLLRAKPRDLPRVSVEHLGPLLTSEVDSWTSGSLSDAETRPWRAGRRSTAAEFAAPAGLSSAGRNAGPRVRSVQAQRRHRARGVDDRPALVFDHIREPVPAIVELFADVEPADGDSRTNDVGPLEMKEGDLIATSIGIL